MPTSTPKPAAPRPGGAEPVLQAALARLPEPVRRQWKQSLVLTVLLLVLAVLGVRQLTGGAPLQKAAASTSASQNAENGAASANRAARPAVDRAGHDASLAARIARADKLERWLAESVEKPSRNVFAIDLKRYPRVQGFAESVADAQGQVGGFWDRVRKSLDQQADDRQRRRDRQDQILRSAMRLNLQSTMTRSKPAMALVGGKLCRVGDAVGDKDVTGPDQESPGRFVLRAIEDGRIVVEQEGVRVSISISGPDRVAIVD